MKLLQSNVLGGNKLNCSETMQVLGGLTQILIWGSETAKGPTRQLFQIKRDLELWYQGGGGGYNFKGELQ